MTNKRGTQTSGSSSAASTPPPAAPAAQAKVAETNNNITVRVGQLGAEPRTIRGAAGMTVEQVLRNADIGLDKSKPVIKGVTVDPTYVVENGDLIIVTAKVRGGGC